MSLIRCNENCVWQKDGYCSFNSIQSNTITAISDKCIYFKEACSNKKTNTVKKEKTEKK